MWVTGKGAPDFVPSQWTHSAEEHDSYMDWETTFNNLYAIIRKNNYFEINGFVINRKYNYNEFTRNDEETGRTYNVGEHKVPSVTTILSKTQSQEKKQALDAWRERVGYQEAARITNQAAVRGTEMHYVLEQYCNGIGYLNLTKEGALPRMMAHTIVDNLDLLVRYTAQK